jgi:hypothetical protein
MNAMPQVIEAYRDYAAPFDVRRAVLRLLSTMQQRHVQGVRAIVLTNLDALSRQQRRRNSKSRGRKVALDQVVGRYHPAWNGQQPWIELFVDQMFRGCPRWVLRLPPLREMMVGDTLYHEVGHHIHATQAPEHRQKENVADEWVRRLGRRYFQRQYWYLAPLAWVLFPVAWLGRLFHRRRERVTKRITTA